jgi:hypothetical protein
MGFQDLDLVNREEMAIFDVISRQLPSLLSLFTIVKFLAYRRLSRL